MRETAEREARRIELEAEALAECKVRAAEAQAEQAQKDAENRAREIEEELGRASASRPSSSRYGRPARRLQSPAATRGWSVSARLRTIRTSSSAATRSSKPRRPYATVEESFDEAETEAPEGDEEA